MSDPVSILDRSIKERGLVAGYVPIQDPQGKWVVTVTVQHSQTTGSHRAGVITRYKGVGRANRIKKAKQLAARDVLTMLPPPGVPPENIPDRLRFLMNRNQGQIVLKGQSTGRILPQCWKFEMFVGSDTEPVATSDWRLRNSAMKQVLWRACVNLGYLNATPSESDMQIDLEDHEDDEDEVEAILDGQHERDGNSPTLQSVHLITDVPSGPSNLPGDIPSDDNTPDMLRYLIARYETATFRVRSLTGVSPVRWEYSLFLGNDTLPCGVSDWRSARVARRQALVSAFEILGIHNAAASAPSTS
ncbi:uncharacterized protein STEHIDRAFT_164005 [Stereum hirsutum FP-91666 SS1]|uniref:Uncharacterized protein n=1 Tax=Stereum hirsutum (strain FP-91666) TaxID=721885 RepID=R7RWI3_STEHR|nr:uncharacterized protein STEHIDRAFT_164005 [Stereum hirsutum FP-91666 SS1]EIM79113.1 hypothetical protein STEHIDRAFT_164005 [Stereum hirsutum FP-91666 SS1]